MKINKLYYGIILLMLVANIVSAAPPVSTIQQFTNGYEIRIPQDVILKQNQDYEFEIHVYNISNGIPITSGIGCYFHLYNETGVHQAILYDNLTSEDFDYSFEVSGTNFSKTGQYYYNVQCNSSGLGGYHSQLFEVIPTGIEPTLQRTTAFNIAIACIFLIAILLFIGFTTTKNISAKYSFVVSSTIFLLVGINLVLNSLTNEVVDPNITALFDFIGAASYYLYWLGGGILCITLILTVFSSMWDKYKRVRFDKYGGKNE